MNFVFVLFRFYQALFLFTYFTSYQKKIFQTRLARAAALFTFGISYQLLFYAQVFKQYSSDVCISILILLISSKVLKKELSLKQWLGLGVVWAFCVLFSYPAYITIAAFYLTVCICCKCKGQNTFVFGSCWFVYFSVWSIKFGKNSLFSLSFRVLEKGV